jgi:hypothetical protein
VARNKRKRRHRKPHCAPIGEFVEPITAFPSDKESLRGRYNPLTPETRVALMTWASA